MKFENVSINCSEDLLEVMVAAKGCAETVKAGKIRPYLPISLKYLIKSINIVRSYLQYCKVKLVPVDLNSRVWRLLYYTCRMSLIGALVIRISFHG